jgi:hypothetical protein
VAGVRDLADRASIGCPRSVPATMSPARLTTADRLSARAAARTTSPGTRPAERADRACPGDRPAGALAARARAPRRAALHARTPARLRILSSR